MGITKTHRKLVGDMFIFLIEETDGMMVKVYVLPWLGYGTQFFGETLV